MKTEDHYILGKFVLNELCCCPGSFERRLFLIGCVEPDYNILTYARGSLKFRFFHGHNAENAKRHLMSLTAKLTGSGISNVLRWFSLGAALHYIADSFTLVHNKSFGENLRQARVEPLMPYAGKFLSFSACRH